MGKYEIGNIFGDFKIIQRVDTGKKYDYVYECQCVNCGYVENRSANVLGFRKNFCKKCNSEYNNRHVVLKTYDDMIDKKVDNLTVKKYIGKKDGTHACFDCECICGNHCIKNITYLNNHEVKHMCPSCEKSNFKQKVSSDEVFVPIDGYEDYYIGNYGTAVSYKNGYPHVMTPWLDGNGKYYYIGLCKGGKIYKKPIHQLVAYAFVDGYQDGFVPNHIDTNTHNNCATNLEWVTQRENTILGYKTMPPNRNRMQCILVSPDGEQKQFNCITDAIKYGIENNLPFSPTGINRYLCSNGYKIIKLGKMSNVGRSGLTDDECQEYLDNIV